MLPCGQVSELMTMSVAAIPPVVLVRELVDTLRNCNHQVSTRDLASNPETFHSTGIWQ